MSKLNTKVYKFFKTKAVSIDEANKTIRFRISDNKPDRMGEIVDQKSWDFKSYLDNPLVLWGHKSEEPEHVLGTGFDLQTSDDGTDTFATLRLDEDINPKASLIWKQLVKGTLRCVSVGFIPHSEEMLDNTLVLKDNELLEISIVPIPANPRAVALDFKSGAISKKDATWLADSMRKEADLIESQIKQENEPAPKEKTMDNEQQTALLDGMKKLSATIDTLAEAQTVIQKDLDTIKEKGAVADVLNADHTWEIQEDKWDNMEDVADMYHALCEAYFYSATPVGDFIVLLQEFIQLVSKVADGTYTDADDGTGSVAKALKATDKVHVKALMETLSRKEADEDKVARLVKEATDKANQEAAEKAAEEEATRKAEEEAKAKESDTSAKDGDNDQSGAQDDELDDDAELTPEAKAKIDEELEAELTPERKAQIDAELAAADA